MLLDFKNENLFFIGKTFYGLYTITEKLSNQIKYNRDTYYILKSKISVNVIYGNKYLILPVLEGVEIENINLDIIPQENEILVRFKMDDILFLSQFQFIVKDAEMVDSVNEIEYVLQKYPEHSKKLIDNCNKILEKLNDYVDMESF